MKEPTICAVSIKMSALVIVEHWIVIDVRGRRSDLAAETAQATC